MNKTAPPKTTKLAYKGNVTELPVFNGTGCPAVIDIGTSRIGDMLRGKCGLVVGVANENSIAFGCAAKLRAFGAALAVTYLNEKAERYVRPPRRADQC